MRPSNLNTDNWGIWGVPRKIDSVLCNHIASFMHNIMAYQPQIPCYLCTEDGVEGTGSRRCDKCCKKICEEHCVTITDGKHPHTLCLECNPCKISVCYMCQREEDDYFPFVKCRRCGKEMCKWCLHSHNIAEHHNFGHSSIL